MMALNKKRNKASALALLNSFFIHNWSSSVVNQKIHEQMLSWIFLDSSIYGYVSLLF